MSRAAWLFGQETRSEKQQRGTRIENRGELLSQRKQRKRGGVGGDGKEGEARERGSRVERRRESSPRTAAAAPFLSIT